MDWRPWDQQWRDTFLQIPEGWLDQSIGRGEFSIRALHCFDAAGIKTFRDLSRFTVGQLIGLPHFGRKTLAEVKGDLERLPRSPLAFD